MDFLRHINTPMILRSATKRIGRIISSAVISESMPEELLLSPGVVVGAKVVVVLLAAVELFSVGGAVVSLAAVVLFSADEELSDSLFEDISSDSELW